MIADLAQALRARRRLVCDEDDVLSAERALAAARSAVRVAEGRLRSVREGLGTAAELVRTIETARAATAGTPTEPIAAALNQVDGVLRAAAARALADGAVDRLESVHDDLVALAGTAGIEDVEHAVRLALAPVRDLVGGTNAASAPNNVATDWRPSVSNNPGCRTPVEPSPTAGASPAAGPGPLPPSHGGR